ncbi:MAG: ribosome maturation factor RimM [Burkholderiaceae bacterium]|nr:ribosome maturation factor RimM [Burkholderiaceae bacterium]
MADTGAAKAPNDLVELGRIVSAYGVRGWVKAQPHSSQSTVLRAAPVWWLCPPSGPLATPADSSSSASLPASVLTRCTPHAVKQCRPQGLTVVAELDGVPDRDVADSKRGYTIYVSREYFPQAKSDEYYWVDLIGCQVFTEDQLMGQVQEVLDNGAHAILRVKTLKLDAKGRPQEVLVPFVAAHVQHVDIKTRRIETDWPFDL